MRTIMTLVSLLTLAAGAAPEAVVEPVAVRAELIQVTDEGASRLGGASQVPEGFFERPERGRVLQSLELMTLTSKDALLVFGHKSAVIYYDHRNSQFQVQYVDTGCKLDVKVDREAGGTYVVESRSEFSRIERPRVYGTAPANASYPQVQVMVPNTTLPGVKPGQSFIVSRTDSSTARQWMQNLGITGGADRLMVVVTLGRGQ